MKSFAERTAGYMAMVACFAAVIGCGAPKLATKPRVFMEVTVSALADSSLAGQPSSELTATDGYSDGRAAAAGDPGPWSAAGYLAGLGGGPVGAGVVWIVAGRSGPEIGLREFDAVRLKGDRYMFGYFEGYREEITTRRKTSALVGGMVGVLASAVMLWVAL